MRRAVVIVAVACGAAAVLAVATMWPERRPLGVDDVPRGTPERGVGEEGPASSGLGAGLTPEQERELERIATLGYVAGVAPVPERTGVVQHTPGSAYDGYTLYTCAEGAQAYLMDMDGTVVFEWSLPGADYWARARLLRGGDLLVITCDPYRMMRLNSRSELLWRYGKPAHHDFHVLPNGIICVLVRDAVQRQDVHEGNVILDDVIALLDPAGNELARVSILDAFTNSEMYSEWLAEVGLPDGPDVLHTNSVQMIETEEGLRALLSIRAIDTVAMLDMRKRHIVWARSGPWRKQHEARMTNGNLLVFDNLGAGDRSRVLEFAQWDGDPVWTYMDDEFYTKGAGAQQRLPNGNTLVTESEDGRVLEVTPGGAIVWEYINPRTTEGDGDAVLGIMRAERIGRDRPLDWAEWLGG